MTQRMLKTDGFILFDGAMGTMLQQEGIKPGELPESYNILHPEIIEKIHKAYLEAGSDIITTNTFGANRLKLKRRGYSVGQVVKEAIRIARLAAGEEKLVALDIGPTGQLLEPAGTLSFEEAYELFAEQVLAAKGESADLILIETMSDLYEVKAAILAAKENSTLPVVCTMTFQKNGRTLTGTDPLTMVNVVQSLGADVLGLNCSLGPKELMPIVKEIVKYARIPVLVQPNAGLPEYRDGETVFNVGVEEFTAYIVQMAEYGVRLFGGCCGTTPAYIKAVRVALEDKKTVDYIPESFTAVSSASRTVLLGDSVKIIGERINPTGKKKIKEALKNHDLDYILNEAVSQKEAGAHILDVNAGLPEIDEKAMMVNLVKELQSIVNLPLQIDSVRADVLEAAVRIYNGKPIINSVNGKKEVMEEIFPIAKKYGACVIGLTLDERGIPSKAEERLEIAEKIVAEAVKYGIPKEDILIDCLVLTASAQQSEVKETVKAVAMVKAKLGVKTTLGVSNVSFGLPNRILLNRTYLAAAMAAGLDAPILNPLDQEMMDTVHAFNVLWDTDREAKEFIRLYTDAVNKPEVKESAGEMDLHKIVVNGMKDEAADKTRELLKEMDGMQIVDGFLIPALDLIGQKYEKGEIFLPQLIQSAETVKKAFEVIREKLLESGSKSISKGKVLLATVKGDIHDIGKNIVKILLQNYGFDVIDLGKDVPPEEVVKTVKEQDIRLVGLSALMTTTVKSMEDTIKALKESGAKCAVMVGGAVLNEEYASRIGADYYGRDAREAVKIAQGFFGENK